LIACVIGLFGLQSNVAAERVVRALCGDCVTLLS